MELDNPLADIDEIVQCCPPPTKTENIVIVGSEMSYDSFWWKMMFAACGFACYRPVMQQKVIKLVENAAERRADPPGSDSDLVLQLWPIGRQITVETEMVDVLPVRPPGWTSADKRTLLIIDIGYTEAEKEVMVPDDVNGVFCKTKADILAYLQTRSVDEEKYLIKNLAIFSHGLPGYIALNYKGNPRINFYAQDFRQIPSDVFHKNGRIYSYACRTAVEKNGSSLAKDLASYFEVPVRAFYRRTYYGHVLRAPEESGDIVERLTSNKDNGEGTVYLSEEHRALPHQGLGNGVLGLYGADKEGTKHYALWRVFGARSYPTAHSTPEDQADTFATFTA